jgi:hypothetical protein
LVGLLRCDSYFDNTTIVELSKGELECQDRACPVSAEGEVRWRGGGASGWRAQACSGRRVGAGRR